jgi:AraC family transcriptional regulator
MTELEPRFEDGAAITVAGLSGRYNGAAKDQIAVLWQRFVPMLVSGKIPGQMGGVTYGVCSNMDLKGSFDYLCGVQVSDATALSQELSHIEVPASRHAVFTHEGPISTISETWQAIFAWMPGSGYRMLAAPSFEWYSEDFRPEPPSGTVEIWIPVEAATIS